MREGTTPLYDAAWSGRAADVAALLAGGADVNEPTRYVVNQPQNGGETPLFAASHQGHTEIVTKLVVWGAGSLT